jgi:two-component system, NarL family, sensor histidine kinase DesK
MTLPHDPSDHAADDTDPASTWGAPWRRWVFPGIWLVYLLQTVGGVGKHSSGVAAVLGYVIVAVFAVCYLVALPRGWEVRNRSRTFWPLYALAVGLAVAESFFAHEDAFVFCVFIAVLTVASRVRWAAAVTVAMAALTTFGPAVIPGWSGKADWQSGLSLLLVSFAMFGFFHIIRANRELAAARAEVARLAAENERSRIARDLHDLLGHSLTTITVKAGLARRLAEHGDAERAFAEISEVEKLSRRTLGDVRAAVSAHRDVTLTGELATAREVLRAARIASELPASVAEAEPALSELFGWVVREAVTNAVRHSRASRVRITLGAHFIEVVDDGHGGLGGVVPGNGLRGLRERVELFGGRLTAEGGLTGFRVRADVPAPAPAEALGEPAPVSAT